MEKSILTAVFLPLALAFIMFGMGLNLRTADFKRVLTYPGAALLGLFNQLILLPIIGFGLVLLFGLRGDLAIGLMILAACPGGVTSNLISYLAKGDTALSISLTAISSFVAFITIPLIVNFSLSYFADEEEWISLPVLETMVQVFGVTLVPVCIGMWINHRKGKIASRIERPIKKISAVLFVLIIVAAIIKEREHIVDYFILCGPVTLALNITTMLVGFVLAAVFALSLRQRMTIAIESGIQNGTLAIMVAASLLGNATMTIPPAIYSLLMFATGFLVILWAGKSKKLQEEVKQNA